MSLETMYQARAAANCRSHVNSFRHLVQIGSGFQTGLGVRIYAVGTLHSVGYCQAYERLLPPAQCPVFLTGLVPGHKLRKQIGPMLADVRKPVEIVFFVIWHLVTP